MSDQWEQLDNPERLERQWKFKNFKRPWELVQQIVQIAEEMNHHPDITFGWGYLKLRIFTHSKNGLSAMDFDFASRVDKIVSNED